MTEAFRPRLLLVEPDDRVRRVVARALQTRFEITLAETGTNALGRLQEERFDVLLLDLGLRDVASFDMLRSVRALAPSLPVIVTTASPEPAAGAEALAIGALVTVMKPFEKAALLAALEPAVSLAKARRIV